MTATESAKVVAMLIAAYPQAQMTRQTSGIYERMLADLDRAVAVAAVERLIGSSRFLPTIAEIRFAAAEVLHGHRRLGGEAWGDVVAEMRRVGWYGRPRFADPVVGDVVRMLGWQGLCSSGNETADRARFIELYDGLAERNRKETVVSKGLALPECQAPAQLGKGTT